MCPNILLLLCQVYGIYFIVCNKADIRNPFQIRVCQGGSTHKEQKKKIIMCIGFANAHVLWGKGGGTRNARKPALECHLFTVMEMGEVEGGGVWYGCVEWWASTAKNRSLELVQIWLRMDAAFHNQNALLMYLLENLMFELWAQPQNTFIPSAFRIAHSN